MTRICFFADGQSIHTHRWCDYFVNKGFEVHLVTFRNTSIAGTNVHFIDCGPIQTEGNNKKILWKIPKIRKLVRKIQPDIVHALYASSYGMAAALCGRKPIVVTALGSDVLISPFQSSLHKKALKYIFKKADRLTAMSEPMKEVMISLDADPQKITTVIFGIDPSVFNTLGRNISDDFFTITSTRNFEPVYNIDVFIKSLAIANKKIPNMRVHIAGAGSMEEMVKKLTRDLKLEDTVKFYGKLKQQDIADLLRQSKLFVSVSSSDGNNISLNEAMACGCFNVVSDIPANRQWIEEGINGYFCKSLTSEDIAASIIKSYDNYKDKIEDAISYNEKIIREKALWSENMKKVEEIYKKLLSHEQ